jgi:hypothetical protein
MIFHNIVTKVELFRNLLIFRGKEQGFLSLKKESRVNFLTLWMILEIKRGNTMHSSKRLLQTEKEKVVQHFIG